MVWNAASQQWLPDVEVDEEFLAKYNVNYGLQYDYANMPKPEPAHGVDEAGEKHKEAPLTKEEKKARKREMEKQPVGWVDIGEDKNTNVYVSGLPSTITEEAFIVSRPFIRRNLDKGMVVSRGTSALPKLVSNFIDTWQNCFSDFSSIQSSVKRYHVNVFISPKTFCIKELKNS